MNLKHKVKLFFANKKRKKENKEFKEETIKKLTKEKREKLSEDKLAVVLDKKLVSLENSLKEFDSKSNEHKAIRIVINSKIEAINWVVDQIYG